MEGTKSALKNLSAIVEGVVPPVSEIQDLAAFADADLIILGAYVQQYQGLVHAIKEKNPKTKIAIWFTSSLGQSDLVQNGIELQFLVTLKEMVKAGALDYLFVGGRKIYYPLHAAGFPKLFLLPFPLDLAKYEHFKDVKHVPYHVGFFNSKMNYKNVINQLTAMFLAKKQEPKLRLFINKLQPIHKFYLNQVLEFNEFTDLDFIPDKGDYYKLVASMACTLQVNYADVCCYAAMSSMAMGVPCIMSNVVDWLPHTKLNRNLVVGRFDSPEYIAEKILTVAQNPQHYVDHVKRMIHRVADMNNQAANHILRELVE